MPRSRKVYNSEFPYHITGRTNDGLIFPCELKEAWNIYSCALRFTAEIFGVRILAFVMMNNHFHLLMTTPTVNLSDFMKYFMKRTSDDIRAIRGHKNHLYGDRYYSCLVDNQNYFQTVLKYIYQNPLRAKICDSVLDYPFSTLRGFLGLEHMLIPVFDDYQFFDNLDQNLKWLEETIEADQIPMIRDTLRGQTLSSGRNKNGFKDDTLLL